MEMLKACSNDCSLLGIDDSRSSFQALNTCHISDEIFSSSLGALFSGGLSRDALDASMNQSQPPIVPTVIVKSSLANLPHETSNHSIHPLVRTEHIVPSEHVSNPPVHEPANQSQEQQIGLYQTPSSFHQLHQSTMHGQPATGVDPYMYYPNQLFATGGYFMPSGLFSSVENQGQYSLQLAKSGFQPLVSGGKAPCAARKHRATKSTAAQESPEGDCKRGQGTWNAEENCAFFEALRRYGKDFEMLHEALKGRKTKEQVSYFIGMGRI